VVWYVARIGVVVYCGLVCGENWDSCILWIGMWRELGMLHIVVWYVARIGVVGYCGLVCGENWGSCILWFGMWRELG